MKQIITLSGDIGSGKSSVAAELSKMTGYDIVGTGKIQRAIAERRGLTTLELNKISATDRSIDDEIDNFVIELGKSKEQLIIDSRLAWHFIPSAFKIYLSVDALIGAERVFGAERSDERNPSLDITLQNNLKRQTYEDDRFFNLYGVHFRRFENYDLVVDTSYTTPEVIAQKIFECFSLHLEGSAFPALWLGPRRVLPTHEMSESWQSVLRENVDRPTTVYVQDGLIYIADGHRKVHAALLAGMELMPACLAPEDGGK